MFTADIIFLCLLSMMIIFAALAWFAFSEPAEYIKWVSPIYWITRRIWRVRPGRYDRAISFSLGTVFVFCMMGLSFLIGGWLTTAFFHLWASPFATLVFP